ncbi:MAG: hypothetical protein Q9167_003887 [Letrouitia subvulpina]
MNDSYRYLPLNSKQRQIRLVTLEPGNWSDPICCTSEARSLDGNPTYDALSYVWGDANNRRPIQLDDSRFEVTENLWTALRRLRDPNIRRVLWIDAQGEDMEVSETGLKSASASRVCEMLEILGADKHFYELPCFVTGDGDRAEITEEYSEHFKAFRKLVDLPWWRRIWVIQEMVLPKNVKFLYSSEEFSYRTLRSVVQGLQVHGTTCCKQYRYTLRAEAFDPILSFQEHAEPMVSTRETWNHQTPVTLFRLRRLFSAFQATEKRDLFYALLGLVTSWGASTPLYPDYGIHLRESATQAVFKCISKHGGLDFLQGESFFRRQEDTPTWIPDAHFTSVPSQWVIVEQRRLRIYSGFSASASISQDTSQLSVTANGTLICQSLMVDKIDKVGPVSEPLEHFEEAPDVFRQWMDMIGLGIRDWPEKPPPEGSINDVFWKTILNDSVELDTSESPFYRRTKDEDYVALRGLWEMFLGPLGQILTATLPLSVESYDEVMSKAPGTVYHLLVCLWQRRMFITERGWIGLAPQQASPVDEIHILLGAPSPFILRPLDGTSKEKDQAEMLPFYTVVGNGYLHNIMSGEAFKGDQKENIRDIALH